MTPEQKRIAIAKACGWLPDDDGDGTGWKGSRIRQRLIGKKPTFSDGKVISYLIEQTVPDYLNDLNAMHEAWLTLPPSKKDLFESELYQVVIGDADYNRNDDAGWITNSTAAQRAEAFLKTLNLWTP